MRLVTSSTKPTSSELSPLFWEQARPKPNSRPAAIWSFDVWGEAGAGPAAAGAGSCVICGTGNDAAGALGAGARGRGSARGGGAEATWSGSHVGWQLCMMKASMAGVETTRSLF